MIPNTNDVIVWDRDTSNMQVAGGWLQRYSVGNPETHAFTNGIWTMPVGFGDLFCAGHTWLPDGRLFVAGGTTRYPQTGADYHRGSKFVGIWDPVSGTWDPDLWARLTTPAFPNPHATVEMAVARWYPTVTLISRFKVLVAGGTEDTRYNSCSSNNAGQPQDAARDTYEVFDLSVPDWERTSQTAPPTLYDGPAYNTPPGGTPPGYVCGGTSNGQPLQYSTFGEYPRLHWTTSCALVLAGESQWATRWRHDPLTLAQSYLSSAVSTSVHRSYGSVVMLPNVGNTPGAHDLLMLLGGGQGGTTVQQTSRILDGSNMGVGLLETMQFPRMVANAVLMPDGSVTVVGGSKFHYNSATATSSIAALTTEVYTKATGWDADAEQVSPRMYHSTAALLPSGNLVSSGSDIRTSDWEIYVPRYFTSGSTVPAFAGLWAPPGFMTLNFNTTYTIDHAPLPAGVTIRALVLMRPCSVTHHSDFDQRYVELTPGGTYESPDQIQVTTPPQPTFTTGSTPGFVRVMPGYWMAFLVTSQGVPSQAKWVRFL